MDIVVNVLLQKMFSVLEVVDVAFTLTPFFFWKRQWEKSKLKIAFTHSQTEQNLFL